MRSGCKEQLADANELQLCVDQPEALSTGFIEARTQRATPGSAVRFTAPANALYGQSNAVFRDRPEWLADSLVTERVIDPVQWPFAEDTRRRDYFV